MRRTPKTYPNNIDINTYHMKISIMHSRTILPRASWHPRYATGRYNIRTDKKTTTEG
ncbi:hypothetical protein BgiMline_035662, partial [Biomphalaria glabrata]